MWVRLKAVTTDRPSFFYISVLILVGLASGPFRAAETADPGAARVRWLVDLGAETLPATAPAPGSDPTVVVSVPGAVYVLGVPSDGIPRKRMRLAADPAAPYGSAATDGGLAVADKQGTVSLWTVSAGAEPALRWRQSLGDRVTSVGWTGGEMVLAATWKGRLVALAAADGRSLWSAELGGRADAPALVDGKDVYVATKTRTLLRLDASTGNVRWTAALPGVVLHPPTLLGQKPRLVVCGTWEGQLGAFDTLTGRSAWSTALPAKLTGAPVTAGGLVAVVTADGSVRGYDSSGQLSWTAPGAASGPATLLVQPSTGAASRLLAVSTVLMGLDALTGARLAGYPEGAAEALRRRFSNAMLEGVKTYSEAEKRALIDREAFDLAGPPFSARLFGPHLAFGTEEGWAYVFETATLRPLARYHAGQASSSAPRLLAGRVLAVAGEDLYALEPQTGRVAWKRTIGADAAPLAGETSLGVLAGGRAQAVRASDGDLRWSLRGTFRALVPPASSAPADDSKLWLVADGENNLRVLQPPGRFLGEPLPAGGELLPPVPLSETSWVAATREGKLLGVDWANASLVTRWEKTLEEPLVEIRLLDGRLLVRSAGALISLDPASQQEGWRVRLAREDRIQVFPQTVAVLAAGEIRIHDAATGESRFQQKVASTAVGVDRRGTSLLWLDRWGGAHRVDMADGRTETTELGLSLAEAVPAPGGFLVTTAAGEIGFIEMTAGGDADRTASGLQSRGVRQ